MQKIIIIILCLFVFGFNHNYVIGHPEPFENELLKNAIVLTNNCSNVSIVEWRGYDFSSKDVKIINDSCNLVYDKFYKFIEKKGIKAKDKIKPFYRLSLIPWDESFDGRGYRNLNDSNYRFNDRPRFCSTNGRECSENENPYPFRGWTNIVVKIVFIRNDPIYSGFVNNKFRAVFAHELFHSLSWESSAYSSHNNISLEENLANEFAASLGYGDI